MWVRASNNEIHWVCPRHCQCCQLDVVGSVRNQRRWAVPGNRRAAVKDSKVMVSDIAYSQNDQTYLHEPSSEQLRNVFGLSSVTIRFVISVWQCHVLLVDPGGFLSGVYSTSESLINRSPAHETILVLLVCGKNLAEKMLPVWPTRSAHVNLSENSHLY
jgi:hypothetical protein